MTGLKHVLTCSHHVTPGLPRPTTTHPRPHTHSMSSHIQHMELPPPADPSITTLWLGNVEADVSDADLREVLYPYGVIQNIHLMRATRCAFVEFASR